MKNTITFILALSLTTFSIGQKKEEGTKTISFKGKVITITTENEFESDTNIVLNNDFEDKKWDVNHWRGLDFGVNGFFTHQVYNVQYDPANVYLELDYARSFMINLNLFEFNTRIGTEHFRFFTGLGFRFNRYAFKSNTFTLSYNDSTISYAMDSLKTFDKNFLNTSYISLPLYFTFMPGKDPNKSFHLSAGAVVNYRIGSRVKQKYVSKNKKIKNIEKGHYHLNPFLIDASVRVGVGDFSLYANYGLNSLFEANKGPDNKPFSLGLSLNF